MGEQCKAATSDCQRVECFEASCENGFCALTPTASGTKCEMGNGHCDGRRAMYIECTTNADCPAQGVDPECASVTCNGGTCETMQKPIDTPCAALLGFAIKPALARRNATRQRRCTSAKECNVPACVQGVCSETPGPDGTMCNWNDLPIATCKAWRLPRLPGHGVRDDRHPRVERQPGDRL